MTFVELHVGVTSNDTAIAHQSCKLVHLFHPGFRHVEKKEKKHAVELLGTISVFPLPPPSRGEGSTLSWGVDIAVRGATAGVGVEIWRRQAPYRVFRSECP